MQLIPFRAEDAATVSDWSADPTEVAHWSGHRGAPVPPEVIAGWADRPDVRAYAVHDGQAGEDEPGELLAYGELWLDDDEDEVELARLIVAPAHRGRGVGKVLVRELTRLARDHHPDVFMRVHPDNAAALRCYAGAGFVAVPEAQRDEWNAKQPVPYAWLTHPRPTEA